MQAFSDRYKTLFCISDVFNNLIITDYREAISFGQKRGAWDGNVPYYQYLLVLFTINIHKLAQLNVIVQCLKTSAIKSIFPFRTSDPPGPPVIKKFTANVLALNVTWSPPFDNGGSRILDYNATLLDVNRTMLQNHTEIKRTSITLQNVQQNRTYIFVVQARNVVGYGKSANASVTTLEAGKG